MTALNYVHDISRHGQLTLHGMEQSGSEWGVDHRHASSRELLKNSKTSNYFLCLRILFVEFYILPALNASSATASTKKMIPHQSDLVEQPKMWFRSSKRRNTISLELDPEANGYS